MTLSWQEFKREYPEIKVVSVTGKGSVLYPRIMAERRAGKNLADVMISGAFPPYPEMHAAKILDPIPPALILPAVKDTSKWFEGKHEYVDHDGKYVFLHTSNPRGGSASYNTKLVDPAVPNPTGTFSIQNGKARWWLLIPRPGGPRSDFFTSILSWVQNTCGSFLAGWTLRFREIGANPWIG